jgi:PKD repeat protein
MNARYLLVVFVLLAMVGTASAVSTSIFYTNDTDAADAQLVNTTQNLSWAAKHDATQGGSFLATDAYSGAEIRAGKIDGEWATLSKMVFLFNTSSLPDDITILSAKIVLTRHGNSIALNNSSFAAVKFNIDGALDATDFDNFDSVMLSDEQYSSNAMKNLTLNNLGLQNISKTGISGFGVRISNDITNTAPTWVYDARNYYQAKTSDGGQVAPSLEITYTDTPACPVLLYDMYNVTGDGTDEGQKLADAFAYSSANTPCGVNFPAGNIITFGNQIIVENDTDVTGNGATLIPINNWNNWSNYTEGFFINQIRLGERVKFHNLTYDGNWNNVNSTVTAAHLNGISLNHDVIFENNTVFNVTAYPVYSQTHKNVTIRNNIVHDGTQYGIGVGAYPAGTYSENASVHDNTISNMTQVGIKIYGCSNCSIYDNNVTIPDASGSIASGIRLYSTDSANNNVSIFNNSVGGDVANTTGAGSTVAIDSDSVNFNNLSEITGNTLNSSQYGIRTRSDSMLISNNSISNSRHTGLMVYSNSSEFYYNTLVNAGILVGWSGAYNPSNNIFRYNSITGGEDYSTAEGDGAYLRYNGTGNIFDFNILNVDRYGFNIVNASGVMSNTNITNNTIVAATGCFNNSGVNTYFFNNSCNGVDGIGTIVASFTKDASIGVQPFAIQFNDTSTNTPTAWNWTFGDGNWSNGTTQNVTHTYDFAGTFNSFLIASNAAGSNQSANQTIAIYDPVTADFTATASGNTVTFTDLSTGTPTSWIWQYNQHEAPGWVEFSTSQNPSYNFLEGTYDINLTATNPGGSVDSEVKESFIVVSAAGEGTVLPDDPPTPYDVAKARYASDNEGMITAMILIFLIAAIVGVAIGIKCFQDGITEATIPLIVGYFIGIFVLVIIFAAVPAIAHVGEL